MCNVLDDNTAVEDALHLFDLLIDGIDTRSDSIAILASNEERQPSSVWLT